MCPLFIDHYITTCISSTDHGELELVCQDDLWTGNQCSGCREGVWVYQDSSRGIVDLIPYILLDTLWYESFCQLDIRYYAETVKDQFSNVRHMQTCTSSQNSIFYYMKQIIVQCL